MKCPRCDADTVRVMTKSPVGAVCFVLCSLSGGDQDV